MMVEQYLLIKLAEEAAEIAQMALKTAQFGLKETYAPVGKSNIERLNDEFNDLLAAIDMLNEDFGVEHLQRDDFKVNNKIAKVKHYMSVSQDLGLVEK